MSENGTEQRRCALDDEHAGIDALCEAENAVLAAEDAHKEAISAKWKAYEAHRESEKDLTNPEIPLEEALERARVTALNKREADAAAFGEDGTQACLNEAKEARDEAFDEMIKRKDHLRGLLDDYDEKREAKAEEDKAKPVNPVVETNDVLNREDTKAEAAPEELYDSDWFMWKVATSILDRTTSGREMIPWKTLAAEMRKFLNERRADYPTLDERLIVNWDHAKASLERLDRREVLICDFGGHAVWVKHGPQFVEEPDPGFHEDGKCLNDVGNPGCLGVTTKGKHGKWKGRFYPRCKPCNDIFQERRDPKPVKPEPDNSGTLFEKPEPAPEPAPVPVPASTAMLEAKPVEAKPEADDLAELICARKRSGAAIPRIGHWHSTRFTVAVAAQLYDDNAKHAAVAVLRAIMTVLEGLGVDSARISKVVLTAISGVSTTPRAAAQLAAKGIITREIREGYSTRYSLTSEFASTLEGDTSECSTRFTVAVNEQLTSDGVSVTPRNVLWACMAIFEGSGEGFPARRLGYLTGLARQTADRGLGILKDLGYIDYDDDDHMVYGLGPKLTRQ